MYLPVFIILLLFLCNDPLIHYIFLNLVTFTDIALIYNNAKVGSQIAVALANHLNRTKMENNLHVGGQQCADSGSDIVSANTPKYAVADSTLYPQYLSSAGGHRGDKCGFHRKGKRKKPTGINLVFLFTSNSTVQMRLKVLMACHLSVQTDQPRKCVSIIWRGRPEHCGYVMQQKLFFCLFVFFKIAYVLDYDLNRTISSIKTL